MMKKYVAALVFAMFAGGCDGTYEPELDESSAGNSEEELGEAEQAHADPLDCPLIMPSEDVDVTWSGDGFEGVNSASGGYGNGDCDGYVVNFSNASAPDDLDYVSAGPYDLPGTELECENTYFSWRVWKKVGGTWSLVTSARDVAGEWVPGLPTCTIGGSTPVSSASDVRIWAQTHVHGFFGGQTNTRVRISASDSPFD